MPSVEERFASKVKPRRGHDLWIGSCDRSGVPQFRLDGRLTTARRVAWELARGPVPPGARVLACPAQPHCVSVAHLALSTPAPVAATTNRPGGAVPSPVPAPARRRIVDDQVVLDAAFRLFAGNGPTGFTMIDLAASAGVSRASLYRRWPSLPAVLRALVGRELAQLAAERVGAVRLDDGPSIVDAVVSLVAVLRDHPLTRSVVANEPTFFTTYLVERRSVVSDDFVRLVTPLLQGAIAAGSLRRPSSGGAEELAATVLLLCASYVLSAPLVHAAGADLDAPLRDLLERVLLPGPA